MRLGLEPARARPAAGPVEGAEPIAPSEASAADGPSADTDVAPTPAPMPEAPLQAAGQLRKSGDLEGAERLLRRWVEEQKTDAMAPLACVLLGVVLTEQSRWAEAEMVLETCEPPASLADRAAFARGEALRHLGRPAQAVEHFDVVAAMSRSPLSPRAGFLIGDSLFEAEAWRRALKQYDRMLDIYPEYPGGQMVKLNMAHCQEKLGHGRAAIQQYARLAHEAREGSRAREQAAAALTRLTERGVRAPRTTWSSRFERASVLRRRRMWADAEPIFRGLIEDAPNRRERANVHYLLARTLESLDKYEEALQQVEEARKAGGAWSELVDAKIRLLRRLRRTPEAVPIVERRSGRSKRVRGLAAAAVWYTDGYYEKAYELYEQYLRTRHNRANQWRLAWVTFRAGHHDKAVARFAKLVGKRGIRAWKAEYWLARAQQEAGMTAEAIAGFKAIAEAAPVEYYGIQSANRLLDMGEVETYCQVTGADPTTLPTLSARGRLGGGVRWGDADGSDVDRTPPMAREGALTGLQQAAETYGEALEQLPRAYDLFRLGMDEEARIELRIARVEYARARRGPARVMARRPSALYFENRNSKRGLWGSYLGRRVRLRPRARKAEERRLSAIRTLDGDVSGTLLSLLISVGDPYWTRRQAFKDSWRTLRGVPDAESRPVFKAAYPLAFEATLREHTEHFGVPAYLMTSIARVESAFNELAVSYAGARGLMQVMPMTGNLIAIRKGDPDFSPADLLDPRVSLEYGTWYMDQLLSKFDGQEPLAIIGYNAGPHRVEDWLVVRGHNSKTDEFIEEVPYGQARRYVKSVLRYISIYRRTYSKRADLYIGQQLDTGYSDNINW